MSRVFEITCTEEVQPEAMQIPPRRIRLAFHGVDLAQAGRKHWEEFHTKVETLEQLADWEDRIPAYGCGCAAKYQELKAKAKNKVLTFEWKVEIHNLVNVHLGKREWTIEEAQERWKPKACDKCGACCRTLVVAPITEQDINREPLLKVIDFGAVGCSLLCNDNTCSVYMTRPDVCRRFEPGSFACNLARNAAGLGDL
jgi:hypothetical protein